VGGQTDTSTIHIHPHPAAISIAVLHSAMHQFAGRPEFVISDDTYCAATVSITHAAPASESEACGGVPTSASRCHTSDVAAVEHFGVDPWLPSFSPVTLVEIDLPYLFYSCSCMFPFSTHA